MLAEEVRAAIAETAPAASSAAAGGGRRDAASAEARSALSRAEEVLTPAVPDGAPLSAVKRFVIRALALLVAKPVLVQFALALRLRRARRGARPAAGRGRPGNRRALAPLRNPGVAPDASRGRPGCGYGPPGGTHLAGGLLTAVAGFGDSSRGVRPLRRALSRQPGGDRPGAALLSRLRARRAGPGARRRLRTRRVPRAAPGRGHSGERHRVEPDLGRGLPEGRPRGGGGRRLRAARTPPGGKARVRSWRSRSSSTGLPMGSSGSSRRRSESSRREAC